MFSSGEIVVATEIVSKVNQMKESVSRGYEILSPAGREDFDRSGAVLFSIWYPKDLNVKLSSVSAARTRES